ncbi:MAG TPA: dual specificity protein phosphatase [Anaerolineales bacterium]|jgi:protein-tyrosine phosphatase|nr:dual specificity protein phosphatase [Anaerolineales bacterium]
MEYSQITEDLFIGTTPKLRDYDPLRKLGIRLVINMRFRRGPEPDPIEPSLRFLWLRTIDSPFFPIPISLLVRGARAALDVIHDDGKVYVHCAYGRHRSVAMTAAILIAQGQSPEAAMTLIKSRRAVADPEIFYIRGRIMSFAREWSMLNS